VSNWYHLAESNKVTSEEKVMRKVLAIVLLGIGTGVAALAVGIPSPEIDPASVGSGLALLTGALLVIRGRRGK
jgi:hypothetical protein